ncbi:MAG: TMEM175 family protein [Acidimicrobiales bacterium]|jgi:uncharacterized membrane protein|nr:TMEM175 family protein [Acidimicrobiales bacterium]
MRIRPEREPASDGPRELRTQRMEALTDGVLAIAITILVFDIKLPEGSAMGEGLLEIWPSYLAYVTSFLTIGGVWLAHSVMTEHLVRADAVLLRMNLALLMVASFLPFPSRLIAESLDRTEDARVSAPFYGIVLIVLGVITSAMWQYARSAGLVRHDLSDTDVRLLTRRLRPTIGLNGVAVLVGLTIPRLAILMYAAIALVVLLPVMGAYRSARHHDEPRPAS